MESPDQTTHTDTTTARKRYRIVAAEAHSWASLLLEDESGRMHIYHVGAGAPAEIPYATARTLLSSRVYRAWRGDQSWHALSRLPLFSQSDPEPDAESIAGDLHVAADNGQSIH